MLFQNGKLSDVLGELQVLAFTFLLVFFAKIELVLSVTKLVFFEFLLTETFFLVMLLTEVELGILGVISIS